MAREIHDTLAQGLVGIITQLEAAAQAPCSDGEWKRHTDAAVELARESLAEARRSVQALSPFRSSTPGCRTRSAPSHRRGLSARECPPRSRRRASRGP